MEDDVAVADDDAADVSYGTGYEVKVEAGSPAPL